MALVLIFVIDAGSLKFFSKALAEADTFILMATDDCAGPKRRSDVGAQKEK
jgi:hypothetical protein